MEWEKLFCEKRLTDYYLGTKTKEFEDRSHFKRDFDRIVFSSAFRRLHGKTQVFPLPGAPYVRTRLTHSLETSSVGRSIGHLVGTKIINNNKNEFERIKVTEDDFASVVASACLAHDIGNPPFGHTGEDSISDYFLSNEGKQFTINLTEGQRNDLEHFEGNALGFRLLTHTLPAQSGVRGGLGLTFSTLATFSKYPKESLPNLNSTGKASEKKFGIFQSDIESFKIIANDLGLRKKNFVKQYKNSCGWYRHPLAFLVEAADDICYKIIDIEDAHKIGLMTFEETEELLKEIVDDDLENKRYKKIKDLDEQIGYLRARAINQLISQVSEVFVQKQAQILTGEFDSCLIDFVPKKNILDKIKQKSIAKIYESQSVLETETAGYEIIYGLLSAFLKAAFDERKSNRSKKLLKLIPKQYFNEDGSLFEDPYYRILYITQFIGCMTDTFAIDNYRIIKGIALPNY